jgi:hypothetical protein
MIFSLQRMELSRRHMSKLRRTAISTNRALSIRVVANLSSVCVFASRSRRFVLVTRVHGKWRKSRRSSAPIDLTIFV